MPKKSLKSSLSIGTTFSYREAEWLGLSWQETLEAILKIGLNPIRIGTYWSEIEKLPGKYDFSVLDTIVSKISQAKVGIILEIGVKAPRWPEFYFPNWLEKKIAYSKRESLDHPVLTRHLIRFVKNVITRYEGNNSIRWLNIENEPLNYSGPRKIRVAPTLLEKEVNLTHKLSLKPIILNSWTEMHPAVRLARNQVWKERSIETCLKLSDILGLSAYLKYPGQPKILKKHWQFLSRWLKKAKRKGKDAWITELQAEPWEKPDKLKNFEDPLGNPSCRPIDIESYFKICQELGFKTILLWGAEFWYRCLKEKNDLWWKTIIRLRG